MLTRRGVGGALGLVFVLVGACGKTAANQGNATSVLSAGEGGRGTDIAAGAQSILGGAAIRGGDAGQGDADEGEVVDRGGAPLASGGRGAGDLGGDATGGHVADGGGNLSAGGDLAGVAGAADGVYCALPLNTVGTIVVPDDYATIQSAIDAAYSGQAILVKPGTYYERIELAGNGVSLVSELGPRKTIIDGEGLGPVVTFRDGLDSDLTVIEGFTIQNGRDAVGAAVRITDGTNGDILLTGNTFRRNQVDLAGKGSVIGGRTLDFIELYRNTFVENECGDANAFGVLSVTSMDFLVIGENVFATNSCRGIAMMTEEYEQVIVSNNTFVGNDTALYLASTGDTVFDNNIFFGGRVGVEVAGGVSLGFWRHNIVYGNEVDFVGVDNPAGMDGNLSVDPLLVGFGGHNVHLSADSPAIDAGVYPFSVADFDLDNEPRFVDGDGDGEAIIDIGADEFVQGSLCALGRVR